MDKFQNSDSNKRYYTQNYFYKKKFGCRVIKVPIDGGFSCPNIDGTCGVGGCIYCSQEPLKWRGKPIIEQFSEAVEPLDKKWKNDGEIVKYIPYFQTFSGTYADEKTLRKLYYDALSIKDTVGLSIATRADCLNDEIVALLSEINSKTFLTVELGLQTVFDETAKLINRGHSYSEFLSGYNLLKSNGINVGVHIINGLPTETPEMMLQTAKEVASLRPHTVKIHMLYIEKGTEIERYYQRNPFPILSREEYAEILCNQLRYFHPDTVIGRITGDGEQSKVVLPLWTKDKKKVMNAVDMLMSKNGWYQGDLFNT